MQCSYCMICLTSHHRCSIIKIRLEFIKANEVVFQELSRETARAMAVLGNAKEVDKYLKRRDKKGETVNMCEALQEMIWEGEKVGEARGEARAKLMGIKAMIADNLDEGISESRIVEKLQKHFSIDQAEAREHLRLYREQENI